MFWFCPTMSEKLIWAGSEMLRASMRGADKGASTLTPRPFQGIVECLQNADDLGARWRLAMQWCGALAADPAHVALSAYAPEAVALGVRSTPGFAINGTVLVGTNEWALLRPQLDARF